MKSSIFLSKIVAALVLALALAWVVNAVATRTVSPIMLDKNVYVVDLAAQPAAATAAAPASAAVAASPATPVAATAAAGPAPIEPLLAAADPQAGAKYAKVCAACHSFNKGEAAKMGPNLYGVVGDKHAHMAGFSYSSGMQALADKVWTVDALNEFLYNPRAIVNGTKMTFAGIKSDTDRANVIAWLRTLSDKPQAK